MRTHFPQVIFATALTLTSGLATAASGASFYAVVPVGVDLVQSRLTLGQALLPVGTIGEPYSFDFSGLLGATGLNPAGAAFSLESGTLPVGMALDARGRLTGVPASEVSAIMLVIKASLGEVTASQTYTLRIAAPLTLALSSTQLPLGMTGESYAHNFQENLAITGGVNPVDPAKVQFTLLSGALPAGLTLSAQGLLSGAPTERHIGTIAVEAFYPSARAVSNTYSVKVGPFQLVDVGGGVRGYEDGTFATSCEGYIRPQSARHQYAGSTGDGVYRLNQNGATKDVYCDMTRDGGGWVLLANYSRNAVSTPDFYAGTNLAVALNPTSSAGTPSGTIGFSQLPALPVTRARFDFIAGDDPNQIAVFYKTVTRANVNTWFKPGQREPDATVTCINYSMTAQCTTRPFDHDYSAISPGDTAGGKHIFWGIELTKYGFASQQPPIAVHGVGNGWCSDTGNLNNNAWRDSYVDGHWGNGMRIWVR